MLKVNKYNNINKLYIVKNFLQVLFYCKRAFLCLWAVKNYKPLITETLINPPE